MSGLSIDEVGRRQRALAQRLEAFGHWDRDAAGTRITARALADLPRGWTVQHDVRLDAGVADHVVVGPGGVFVVTTRSWSGRVNVVDGVLRQAGNVRGVHVPIDTAAAVADLLDGKAAQQVHAVLCVARDEEVAGAAQGVLVCSAGTIRRLLLTRPTVLSRRQVRAALRDLAAPDRGSAASVVLQASSGPAA
ncbi:NERD domain-containing protein [Nocardioides dongkuii]|uniref:NERD domain-containing protein n=1 Tax=Nocardioides dongkuii TaxID=2760089 RepID=UPI001877930B|nr:NERD domain-containing protein [Nocardioides dongkuii]